MKSKILLCFLWSGIFILTGCGYTTKAYFLPSSIKNVYIETFENKTDQPNLENELRTKLISTFQIDGNLEIASVDEADTLLQGEVVGYSRQAMRYENNEAVQEYRLSVAVNFEFIERSTGKKIVQASNFSGDASFYLTGSSAGSESQARDEALVNLSRRILNKVITLW